MYNGKYQRHNLLDIYYFCKGRQILTELRTVGPPLFIVTIINRDVVEDRFASPPNKLNRLATIPDSLFYVRGELTVSGQAVLQSPVILNVTDHLFVRIIKFIA